MKNFFKKNQATIVSTLLGVAVTFFITTFEVNENNKAIPGGISIEQADKYAMEHSDHVFKSWRKRSHGIWYDTGHLNQYMTAIKDFIKDPVNKPLNGYDWRVGIYYGGGKKSDSNHIGLLTMFVPMLVKFPDSSNVIDVFDVLHHGKTKPDTVTLKWDHTISYATIFNKYYKQYASKAPGDDNIVFDSGNMFP